MLVMSESRSEEAKVVTMNRLWRYHDKEHVVCLRWCWSCSVSGLAGWSEQAACPLTLLHHPSCLLHLTSPETLKLRQPGGEFSDDLKSKQTVYKSSLLMLIMLMILYCRFLAPVSRQTKSVLISLVANLTPHKQSVTFRANNNLTTRWWKCNTPSSSSSSWSLSVSRTRYCLWRKLSVKYN